jgi:hypothetical protein
VNSLDDLLVQYSIVAAVEPEDVARPVLQPVNALGYRRNNCY